MKRIAYLLVLSLLIGCGGGGGDGGGSSTPAFTPPDPTGHYVMTGVSALTSNGYTFTENDFYPWGGYIDIGHVTLAMSLTLLGETTSGSGPLSVSCSSLTTPCTVTDQTCYFPATSPWPDLGKPKM